MAMAGMIWEWRKAITGAVVWYAGLRVFRDYLGMGDVYLILCGFMAISVIGFQPRLPGEVSAYSHMNENHERILGSMDANQAAREMKGGGLLPQEINTKGLYKVPAREPIGNVLGRGGDEADEDLQRALLLSLKEDRDRRRN